MRFPPHSRVIVCVHKQNSYVNSAAAIDRAMQEMIAGCRESIGHGVFGVRKQITGWFVSLQACSPFSCLAE
jgi:hypothetical protein